MCQFHTAVFNFHMTRVNLIGNRACEGKPHSDVHEEVFEQTNAEILYYCRSSPQCSRHLVSGGSSCDDSCLRWQPLAILFRMAETPQIIAPLGWHVPTTTVQMAANGVKRYRTSTLTATTSDLNLAYTSVASASPLLTFRENSYTCEQCWHNTQGLHVARTPVKTHPAILVT